MIYQPKKHLFMPAEPNIVKYAYRVAQDIPDGLSKVKWINMDEEITTDITNNEADDVDAIWDEPLPETMGPTEQYEIDDNGPLVDEVGIGVDIGGYMMEVVVNFKHELL